MIKILFVCHGNICRSPMAEYVMKDMIRRRSAQSRSLPGKKGPGKALEDEFEIASAATSREEIGNPVYPPARRKLAEHGISCEGHRARRITQADYEYYDLIICMDHLNLRNLERFLGGDPYRKISLLLDYTDRAGQEVADPWWTGDFDATWDDITEGCKGLLEKLEAR